MGTSANQVAVLKARGQEANAYRTESPALDAKATVTLVEAQPPRRKIALEIYPFYDVEQVKRLMIMKGIVRSSKLNDIKIMHRGILLSNSREMNPYINESRSDPDPVFEWSFSANDSSASGIRIVNEHFANKRVRKAIGEIRTAINRGIIPKLTLEGTAGTYICYDSNKVPLGLLKPTDEEAFAPFNPRGFTGEMMTEGFRSGILSGESSMREVAAYHIDCLYHHFYGIPATCHVEIAHPCLSYGGSSLPVSMKSYDQKVVFKSASFQEFVHANSSASDFDCREYSIGNAHRLALLDIAIVNLDRNEANALVVVGKIYDKKKPTTANPGDDAIFGEETHKSALLTPYGKLSRCTLVPIDHGLCIPDCLDIARSDWVWMNWPHTKIPLSDCELQHVSSLDPDRDALELSVKMRIRPACLRILRIAGRFLRIAVSEGLTLFESASLMSRPDSEDKQLSELEIIIKISLRYTYEMLESTNYVKSKNKLVSKTYTLDLQAPGLRRHDNKFFQAKKDGERTTHIASIVETAFPRTTVVFDERTAGRQGMPHSVLDKQNIPIVNRPLKFSRTTGAPIRSEIREEEDSESVVPQSDGPSILDQQSRLSADATSFVALKTRPRTNLREISGAVQDPIWSIRDRDQKLFSLPWDNHHFERLFFEVYERNVWQRVNEEAKNTNEERRNYCRSFFDKKTVHQ